MDRDVSVVLITFDSAEYLSCCLPALRAQKGVALELVVVDNASSDRSLELVAEHFPAAQVIRNGSNRGFAAAANQGIAASRSAMILLLNPDVRLAPDYVIHLADMLSHEGSRYGSASGKLLAARGNEIAPTGQIDSLGIRMTRNGRHLDRSQGEIDSGTSADPIEVFGVSGAAALYRRDFLDDVAVDGQPFDERFFAYREDADLSWRGQLRGWRSVVVPQAKAWHVRRVTPAARRRLSAEINMHSVKNRFLLRLNSEGRYLFFRNLPFEAARDLMVLGAVILFERSSLPALSWLWQHRAEIMRRRKSIQQRRLIPDRALAHWFR